MRKREGSQPVGTLDCEVYVRLRLSYGSQLRRTSASSVLLDSTRLTTLRSIQQSRGKTTSERRSRKAASTMSDSFDSVSSPGGTGTNKGKLNYQELLREIVVYIVSNPLL